MNIQRLKQIMREKNMSAYQLAKISGITLSTLSRILRGQIASPGILTVIAIARALETDINCIIDI